MHHFLYNDIKHGAVGHSDPICESNAAENEILDYKSGRRTLEDLN